MLRREFIRTSLAATGAMMLPTPGFGDTAKATHGTIDSKTFHSMRRFADLPMARVAYIERGNGPVALFLHGFPLNGYQWRGAIQRLSGHRRCIAADFMGLGYTEVPEGQEITLNGQADMLAALLDHLSIDQVDLVANDSGGLIAQLFVARHASRVRSLLLTNCDVDENSPPALFVPLIDMAKKTSVADKFIAPQLADKDLCRNGKGTLGSVYNNPADLTDETIECYLGPLVSSSLRKQKLNQYTLAFDGNPLIPIRPRLKEFTKPARMVWALNDPFFGVQWAEWLDHTLPGSRGVRRIEDAKLFFPEEMPDIISEEAAGLWGIKRL